MMMYDDRQHVSQVNRSLITRVRYSLREPKSEPSSLLSVRLPHSAISNEEIGFYWHTYAGQAW